MNVAVKCVDWGARTRKRAAVSQVMREVRRRLGIAAPARRALMMPAADWHCVVEALDEGVLSRDASRVVAVERDPFTFARMAQNASSMGFSIPPDCRNADLADIADPGRGIGFAFLDLCAFPDVPSASWIHDILAPALAQDAVVAITMACDADDRRSALPPACRTFFIERHPDAVLDLQARLRFHGSLQSIDEESAVCAATAMALLAPAGCAPAPTVLRPYSDGHRTMTVVICRVTGRPGAERPFAAILEAVEPMGVAGRPDFAPAVPDELLAILRRIEEAQRARAALHDVRQALLDEIARVDRRIADIDAPLPGLIAAACALVPQR